jgi:hypothetical protein
MMEVRIIIRLEEEEKARGNTYHVMLIASPSTPPVKTFKLVVDATCNKPSHDLPYHELTSGDANRIDIKPPVNTLELVVGAMCNKPSLDFPYDGLNQVMLIALRSKPRLLMRCATKLPLTTQPRTATSHAH